MTKEEILNGMSEEEFYQMYPTKESWEAAYKMKLGGLSGAPHNGQPTADEFFSYGSHANDKLNIPMGNPFYLAHGGTYYGGPIYPAAYGGYMQPGGPVTFAQPKTSAQYERMKNKLSYTDEELQGVGVSKPGLSEEFLRKQKEQKGQYTPATGGGYTKIGSNPNELYDYVVGQGYQPRPVQQIVNTLPPQKYGGGLPGGPHEMPCMECGGYMEDGGFYTGGNYNSPTNYGSFSVPMTYGGDLDMAQDGRIVDWAKQQQQNLAQRTGQGTPSGVSKYYGAFDVPNLSKMDSVVTSPINPNIGMAFKGSKSMLVPLDKSAEQDVRKINKPFIVATPPSRGEREVFVSYQEFGGAYDPSVAGTYPMLDMGGLKKIIYAAAKKTKKAYGGDTVIPGGNQDYKEQYRNTFDNFIKQNTYNAIVDNEREAMMNELAQMDQPSYNMPMGGYDMDFAKKGKQTSFRNPNGPGVTNPATNKPYTWAEFDAAGGWEKFDNEGWSKVKDYVNKMSQSQNQANTQRSKVMEGLANMFAPTQRTGLFSNIVPANIYRGYEFSNKDYDYLKSLGDDAKISGLSMEYGPLARGLGKFGRRMFGPKSITFGTVNPNKGYFEDLKEPYQLPTETQDNKTNRVSNKAVKEQLKQDALRNKIIDERKNAIGLKAYGGLFKAYDGVQNPIKFTAPISDDRDIMPPTIEETKPADYNPFTDQAAIQKRRKEQEEMFGAPMDAKPDIFAPGKSVTAKRETDWSSLASYAPGAINTLAASFEESSPMGLIGRGSARYRKNEADKRQAAMYTPGSNQGPFVSTPSSARDMGNYTINQGMFRPDDAAYAQSPGNIYGYAQMGGYVEGEELDLSPEQIAELIAQGYEIEELD